MCEPEHIWFSLTRPWKQRQGKKLAPFWPEDLIRELFHYQIGRGRHLHLTGEPEMFSLMSGHLAEVQQGMLCLVHNPADLGRKTVPSGNNHLNKKTVVFTTSRALQQALDTRITAGTNTRQAQQHITDHNTSVHHTSSHHTRRKRFADKVALCLQREVGMPLPVEEPDSGQASFEAPTFTWEIATSTSNPPSVRRLMLGFPLRVVFTFRKGTRW